MDRLARYARERLELEEPLILGGDYNVIPANTDARYPERWTGDAGPAHAEKFRAL
jgi:exodeoxyribonuclease-3